MPTTLIRPPEAALEERWRWLDHQGASEDPVVKQHTLEMLEDAASNEDRARRDYFGRYAIELLQNAHDASADSDHVGAARFVVTPSALLVANEGVPFTYERVKSLLRMGASEKAPRRSRRRLIGYKGIGFSSVFEVCDRPQVISETLAFGFDPDLAKTKIKEALGAVPKRIPIRPFAVEIQPSAWAEDRRRVEALFRQGAVTVIRLPLRADHPPDAIEELLEASITPETLLFMPAISELSMRGPALAFSWSRRRGRRVGKGRLVVLESVGGRERRWLIREGSVPVRKDVVGALPLRDESWADVRRLNVTVALPWRRGIDPRVGPQNLHVYFPTDDELGRALLIHGDFYVHSSRRQIEENGPGGEITRLVAEEAARLVAGLAASVAQQGNVLLRSLAQSQEPNGFGRTMGGLLDAELRTARIVRASNGGLRRPAQVERLNSDLGGRDERLLSQLAGPRGDLLHAGDDNGEAAGLLETLGTGEIDSDDLADLFDGSRFALGYGALAGLLTRWLDSLNAIDQRAVVRKLRQRPILLDTEARWSHPAELVVRAERGVDLPKPLRRREVKRPPGTFGRSLIERLEVAVLDASNALEVVLDAIDEESYGLTRSEMGGVLAFLRELWRLDPAKLRAQTDRLGAVQVPTFTAQRRKREWRRADETYFSRAWLQSPVLEHLYGSDGKSEFLAEPAPPDPRKREFAREFFRALGVADSSRQEAIEQYGWTTHAWLPLERVWEWQGLTDFAGATCPEGHPQSLEIRLAVADRLDDVLGSLSKRKASALAVSLAASGDPYGADAEVWCVHGSHPVGRLVTTRVTPGN